MYPVIERWDLYQGVFFLLLFDVREKKTVILQLILCNWVKKWDFPQFVTNLHYLNFQRLSPQQGSQLQKLWMTKDHSLGYD